MSWLLETNRQTQHRPFILTITLNNWCDLVLAVRPGCSFFYFISVPADWTEKLLPREIRIAVGVALCWDWALLIIWNLIDKVLTPHKAPISTGRYNLVCHWLCWGLLFNEWYNRAACDLVTVQGPTGHTRNDKCIFFF